MSRPKLKICGITSLVDARAAIDCGADFLGFNFFRPSPRFIEPTAARAILGQLPGGVETVGIFVNEARPEDVVGVMSASGVRFAQLHGEEDPAYCAAVGPERVIKALRITDDFDPRRVLRYPSTAILLDTYDAKLYGGTGRTTNWDVARMAARMARVFLAGGLSAENVAAAIRAVEPFAIDLNSGVESAPGRKDPGKLESLKKELQACH
jgi:phosphoribosylanthranilate isomerase